jgi:hypothetical protein
VGYTGVEVVRGCNWVTHRGGTGFSQKPKPSRRGSVLANEVWGSDASCRGDPIGVRYTGVELVRGCDWVRHEGGTGFSQKSKPSRQGSVLANKVWGSDASCEGTLLG